MGVSAAAVIRFSHKLGYSGFTAMKVDLAGDRSEEISGFDDMIDENDSVATVIKRRRASIPCCRTRRIAS